MRRFPPKLDSRRRWPENGSQKEIPKAQLPHHHHRHRRRDHQRRCRHLTLTGFNGLTAGLYMMGKPRTAQRLVDTIELGRDVGKCYNEGEYTTEEEQASARLVISKICKRLFGNPRRIQSPPSRGRGPSSEDERKRTRVNEKAHGRQKDSRVLNGRVRDGVRPAMNE